MRDRTDRDSDNNRDKERLTQKKTKEREKLGGEGRRKQNDHLVLIFCSLIKTH